jgi:hypothetical protein
MIGLYKEFRYDDSLIIAIKPKAEYRNCMDTILFHILKYITLTKTAYFQRPFTIKHFRILHQVARVVPTSEVSVVVMLVSMMVGNKNYKGRVDRLSPQ